MFRNKLIALITAAVIGMTMYGGSDDVFAQDGSAGLAGSAATANRGELCPVSGEKIDQPGEYTYKYKGKVYDLCSAGCVEDFKKDPEKYILKMKGEGAVAKPMNHQGPDHH